MDNTETIAQINIEDEMRQSYMDYAMSVIVGRALPEVRDGLKPVQRRIIYAMHGEGLQSNKKFSKCAGVVGEVLKRLHPHGDMPVYEALVGLAQPWSKRYPLVDGQGNFGSIDGDPAAAYRYTECRMTAIAERLLIDIDKETIDFAPNFDESSEEPLVLPAQYPNLLVNGADGIAVGMATHIPPHNLTEVINATLELIRNPKLSMQEIMQIVPGPDFPTGGILYGKKGIISAYSSGKGIVRIRAKTAIETLKKKSREVEAIIITEIPYQVNKTRLIEKIAELANDKKIDGLSNIRDESDRKGMRVVLELKKDAVTDVVLNQLFKLTPMQTSFGIINLAIVDNQPVVCTIKDLLVHFVNHRRDVIVRRTQYQLRKAEERMHLLEGFKIALLNIDDVIALIKAAQTPKEARDGLMAKYELSQVQAQAILDLRLQKLTGMERLAIEKEHEELANEIERLRNILADGKKVDGIISEELSEIKETFGDKRRTQIVDEDVEIDVEELIVDDEVVVSISHQGYIKRTPTTKFRAQKRGGKGVTGASSKDDDFTEHLFVSSNRSDLLCFTNTGRMYWLKVYQLPEASRTARGRALVNLLRLREDETITAVLSVSEFSEDKNVFFATRKGFTKRIQLNDFAKPRKGGVIVTTLDDDDALIGVGITDGESDIILSSASGQAIRFAEDDIRIMGRTARGVRGMNLADDDQLVGMSVVRAESKNGHEESTTLLTICENGYGKRTCLTEYRCQTRGGKGVIDIRTEGRNGPVVRAHVVQESSGAMIITDGGKVIRINVNDISVIGRNTQGVRIINLDSEEKVSALAHIADSDENGEGEDE
ncbi:MAG: DNA gyrase subunit A [Deltaproteobacteria bacterium]|nr:DNA gyrase subunit A [Deltaproteobacteria bacterium]